MIRSPIERAQLPEQVDVILSVFTGNLLFTEGLLPSLYHARDRYLKPGGILLPDRARLMLQAVDAGETYKERVGQFRQRSLGIDFSPLASMVANHPAYVSRKTVKPVPMSRPVTATELDFRSTHVNEVTFEGNVDASSDGVVNALLGWIDIGLGTSWLSTAPDAADVHWSPGLLPFADPVEVVAGERLTLKYRFIDDERMFWSIKANDHQQQQSTVLHNQDLLIDMQLSAADCTASLSEDGHLLSTALSMMAKGTPNRVIADALMTAFPGRYPDPVKALKAVGRMSASYRRHPARDA